MMSLRDYNRMLDQMDDERLPHDPDEFVNYDAVNYDRKHRPLGVKELTAEIVGCEIRDTKL